MCRIRSQTDDNPRAMVEESRMPLITKGPEAQVVMERRGVEVMCPITKVSKVGSMRKMRQKTNNIFRTTINCCPKKTIAKGFEAWVVVE